MEMKSQPRVLQKSIRYPTYQLAATASSSKETPENQLVICALSVLEWIRAKLQAFEIPDDFQAPSPDEYESCSLEQLRTARIDAGYTVETVCDPEEKVWAFRLIEPDLSTRWNGKEEVSTAVPGRIYETNLAFRAADGTLYCGVSVIVSEPENTAVPCRAHRPAVVQRLAVNPLVGLASGRPLENRLWDLNSREKIKNLRNDLQNGVLPAVIFCSYSDRPRSAAARAAAVPAPDFSQMVSNPSARIQILSIPQEPEELGREPYFSPYDTALFASARMAYVHSFSLPEDQFETFQKFFQIGAKNGAVIFIEPQDLGGGYQIFEYRKEQEEETFSRLMDLSRDYLCRKPVKFKNVRFLTEAKLRIKDRLKQANMDVEEAVRVYEDRQELLKSTYEDKLLSKNEQIEQQAAKITRLKNLLDEQGAEIEQIRMDAGRRIAQAEARVEAMRGRLEYLESLPLRPKTPKEIVKWVQERFAGRLEFHAKAVKKLEDVPPNDVDMQLLCDALEYLAHEYRDLRAGIISRDEANRRASEKYGRPFEVSSNGATSIEMYAGDYKIKYNTGPKGKPVETPLTDHLKVGKTAGNLIRIYFLYDDVKRKVVVGSLPYHLKVAQIQG